MIIYIRQGQFIINQFATIKIQMLLRPPTINQQQADNTSRVITQSDAQHSSRSKNKIKKKESALSFRNKHQNTSEEVQQRQRQRQNDIGSVRSIASGRSKKSKKKQSSIGKNKPREYIMSNSPRRSEPDDTQVLDYEKISVNPGITNKIYELDQSQIKQDNVVVTAYNYSPINENRSPNVRNNNANKNVVNNYANLSVGSKQEIEDQIPVVKLVQNNNNNKNISAFALNNPNSAISPKVVERRQTRKLGQLFEETRKNPQNSSQLGFSAMASDYNNSSIAGQSRRSKSKLGQLFKQKSKQKQVSRTSKISFTQNSSQNFQYSVSESNWKAPQQQQKMQVPGSRSREKISVTINNMPEKVLEESVKNFQPEDINRSELNLSLSRNSPAGSKMQHHEVNNRDSVCFNLEPQRQRKKKGLGLASKMQKDDEMIKISGNLHSKQIEPVFKSNGPTISDQRTNVPSKQLAAHQKLKMNLQQNQRYLAQSGMMGVSNAVEDRKRQQILKMQEENRRRQLELEREKAAVQERNRLERIRLEEQKRIQKRRQQQLIYEQQRLKKQQERRKQQVKKQQQRIKSQQRKQRIRQQQAEIQRQKLLKAQRQLQQQRQQIQNDRKQFQQIKRQKEAQQKRTTAQLQMQQKKIRQEAQKQRQRLRQAYKKQKQQIKKNHEQNQKSIIYQLESQELNKVSKNKDQLEHMPSTYSRDQSQRSSKSKQSKKSTRKKEGVISRNTKKHLVVDASPRAEQSFYEENTQQEMEKQTKIKKAETMQAPRKLMSFNQSEQFSTQPKIQCKTDTYFYDKSSKAHSRPPLSKKSSSSKSKPKQGLIQKKTKDSQIKLNQPTQQKNTQKKLSLVEIAMRKNYEPESGSEYHSQDSFRSRENSANSSRSRNSKNSKGSKKKESVVKLKQSNLVGNRPPLYKKTSSQNQDNLMMRTQRHERQMRQRQRQRQIELQRKRQQKPTVIKGCSFIDQRGRLIQNGNMIIQGSQVTGYSSKHQLTQQKFVEKLRNSRAKRRSQSRQRSLNKSRASSKSIQKKNSRYDPPIKNEYVESEAYSETQYHHGRRFQTSDNFYTNHKNDKFYNSNAGSYANTNSNYKIVPQSLQQFVKPIQEAGIARAQKDQVGKKRSMQRTQRV